MSGETPLDLAALIAADGRWSRGNKYSAPSNWLQLTPSNWLKAFARVCNCSEKKGLCHCHNNARRLERRSMCMKDDACIPWHGSGKINGYFPSHHQITQKTRLLAAYTGHKESSVKTILGLMKIIL